MKLFLDICIIIQLILGLISSILHTPLELSIFGLIGLIYARNLFK